MGKMFPWICTPTSALDPSGTLFTTTTPGKDFTTLCHALMLIRLETDTIGRSLGNGVLAMVALGTGMTPPMWSFSGCGYLLRWMPMSTPRKGESSKEWNYLSLLEHVVAPADLCSRETFCIPEEDEQGNLLSTSYNATMAKASFQENL